MNRGTVASTDRNHIDPYLGTSYGDSFRLSDVVDAVVRFANGDIRPSAGQNVHPIGKHSDGTDLYLVPLQGEGAVKAPRAMALEHFEKQTDRARTYAVEVLAVATQGTEALFRLVGSFGTDLIDAVNLAQYPTLQFAKDGRPTLQWRVSGPGNDLEKWIRFAAVLIADAAGGKNTGIARCQLPSCNRFFSIVRRGVGKPSTKYCPGTDHMDQAHRANSTLRSQRKRRADRRRAARAR